MSQSNWWEYKQGADGLANQVTATAETLIKYNVGLRLRMKRNLQYYLNRIIPSLGMDIWDTEQNVVNDYDNVTNLSKSAVDTFVSKMCSDQTKPTFKTEGGTFSARRKAQKMSEFSIGAFDQLGYYRKYPYVLTDAAIFGRGFMDIRLGSDDRPEMKRILPYELLTDPRDAKYGNPSHLYHLTSVAKDWAAQVYGIDPAKATYLKIESNTWADAANMCTLIECWHLPSTPDSGDGRKVLCTSSEVIEEKEWTLDHFPFVSYSYSLPIHGFWAPSLIDGIARRQDMINTLDEQERRQGNCGNYVVLCEQGSIITSTITNEDGLILKYNGRPPQFVVPNTLSPELLNRQDRCVSRAYEMEGISRIEAQSTKPQGFDPSGEALREWADISSERFADKQIRGQDFMVACTRRLFEVLEDSNAYDVLSGDRKNSATRMTFADIHMPETQYSIHASATNAIASSPSAQIAKASEEFEKGFLTREECMSMMSHQDLEAITDRANAPYNAVMNSLELMLDRGIPVTPTRYDDPQFVGPLMARARLQAWVNNEDPDRIALVDQYLAALEAMTPAPAAQGQPMVASGQTIQSYQAPAPGGAVPPGAAPAPAQEGQP